MTRGYGLWCKYPAVSQWVESPVIKPSTELAISAWHVLLFLNLSQFQAIYLFYRRVARAARDSIFTDWWLAKPLWKIWVCQLGWWHSQYIWENEKCSKPPIGEPSSPSDENHHQLPRPPRPHGLWPGVVGFAHDFCCEIICGSYDVSDDCSAMDHELRLWALPWPENMVHSGQKSCKYLHTTVWLANCYPCYVLQ